MMLHPNPIMADVEQKRRSSVATSRPTLTTFNVPSHQGSFRSERCGGGRGGGETMAIPSIFEPQKEPSEQERRMSMFVQATKRRNSRFSQQASGDQSRRQSESSSTVRRRMEEEDEALYAMWMKRAQAAAEKQHNETPEWLETLVKSRGYSAYSKGSRASPEANYAPPGSGRERWWRVEIKPTPIPGRYEITDFIHETNQSLPSAIFLDSGRRRNTERTPTGAVLLPGAYETHGFIDDLHSKVATTKQACAAFKASGKEQRIHGVQDKDIDVPPNAYNVAYRTSPTPKTRSPNESLPRLQRVPFPDPALITHPPPGHYNPSRPVTRQPIASSFVSRTARFRVPRNNIPGPGTYDPVDSASYLKVRQLRKMARWQGLHFTPRFL